MRVTRLLALLTAAVLAVALPVPAAGASGTAAHPDPYPAAGDTQLHDPTMIRLADGRYVVYGSHGDVAAHVSTDMVTWTRQGGAFAPRNVPAWWDRYTTEDRPWAPDITYAHGQYWLYYAVSTFGSQHSAIGLATSPTGAPGTFTDRGIVLSSAPGDRYNAIDPAALWDDGRLWLTFGSYWTGIHMVELNPATGLRDGDPPVTHLATRPDAPHAVEAGQVVRRGGWYYLFASYDTCCAGLDSTYKIRVGRASSPTGPFTDSTGRPMLDGGGDLLRGDSGRYRGPGGQHVLLGDGGRDLLVHHYYDTERGGEPHLAISRLGWTADGWPVVVPAGG
ncbi:arabinan endo-1,5-alpha-L-arabinosidase [Streptomyces carpaticus]|uniref:arabinan endo-1,5-alpha-L-arabinosidase n=1 Tax=Streptomyces TaxID=1883 RepID=UPI00220CA01D|nr:arabinan endo-1,5-alpha-L-arabinosidase [Streptomyces carpaticus]